MSNFRSLSLCHNVGTSTATCTTAHSAQKSEGAYDFAPTVKNKEKIKTSAVPFPTDPTNTGPAVETSKTVTAM